MTSDYHEEYCKCCGAERTVYTGPPFKLPKLPEGAVIKWRKLRLLNLPEQSTEKKGDLFNTSLDIEPGHIATWPETATSWLWDGGKWSALDPPPYPGQITYLKPGESIKNWLKKQPLAGGRKDDSSKNQLDLVDPDFIEGVGAVLTYGASKYEPWNWARGISYRRVFSACLRHLFAWWKGEENDPETGLSHLHHAGCNLQFLAYYSKHKEKYKEFDDRFYEK